MSTLDHQEHDRDCWTDFSGGGTFAHDDATVVYSCIAVDGNTASVTFTLTEATTVSFVSYKAPVPKGGDNSAFLEAQTVFDSTTVRLDAGRHTLEVMVPNCAYQVDLVLGGVLEHLSLTTNYSNQGRLVTHREGGSGVCDENEGGEGCTPGYWKNHTGAGKGKSERVNAWAPTGLTTEMRYDAVFGVDAVGNFTLLEALNQGGGGEYALMRHAVAALLNARHPNVSYEYTASQVIAMVQSAYASGNFEEIKNLLAEANEVGCPL